MIVPNRQSLAGLTVEESTWWDLCGQCGDWGHTSDPEARHIGREFRCGDCVRNTQMCNFCGGYGKTNDPDCHHTYRGFYCGACCRGMARTKGD